MNWTDFKVTHYWILQNKVSSTTCPEFDYNKNAFK